MIKTIPLWKMMMITKGNKVGFAVLASLPVFIVAGAWMFLEGLQSGQKRQAAIGLICLVFFLCVHLAIYTFKKIYSRQDISGL